MVEKEKSRGKELKTLLPVWAWPLNVFQLHGTLCCENMYRAYQSKNIILGHFCYEATSINEANILVIWGSLSTRLATLVIHHIEHMMKNRYVLHIRGCDKRIDNEEASASIAGVLPVDTVISSCALENNDIKALLEEARRCLRV